MYWSIFQFKSPTIVYSISIREKHLRHKFHSSSILGYFSNETLPRYPSESLQNTISTKSQSIFRFKLFIFLSTLHLSYYLKSFGLFHLDFLYQLKINSYNEYSYFLRFYILTFNDCSLHIRFAFWIFDWMKHWFRDKTQSPITTISLSYVIFSNMSVCACVGCLCLWRIITRKVMH